MAASRRQAAVVVAGMISLALAACDTLLGLGQYQDVACAIDCDSGTKESGTGPSPDAAGDVDAHLLRLAQETLVGRFAAMRSAGNAALRQLLTRWRGGELDSVRAVRSLLRLIGDGG